jgi:hypothetical protein
MMRDSTTGLFFYMGIVLSGIGLILAIILEGKGIIGMYSMILPCLGILMSMGSVMFPTSYKSNRNPKKSGSLNNVTQKVSDTILSPGTLSIEK